MGKIIYVIFFAAIANWAAAQNNIGLNNVGLSNANDNYSTGNTANNSTGNGSNAAQTNFLQQLGNAGYFQYDNNIGISQQATQPVPVNDAGENNQGKGQGISFSLPKASFSGASGASGRHRAMTFSKRMKKLNRKMTYVFSKKNKRSFAVDYCFAWK